jgi:hypothetical protein
VECYYDNVLDIHRPNLIKNDVSETGICLRPQVKPTLMYPIDRGSPYLVSPEIISNILVIVITLGPQSVAERPCSYSHRSIRLPSDNHLSFPEVSPCDNLDLPNLCKDL